MGLDISDCRTARICGGSIDDIRMHREIGFLPEQPYFYDYLTARELLDYYAHFRRRRGGTPERVEHSLNWLGLAAAADVQLRKFLEGNAAARRNSPGDPA